MTTILYNIEIIGKRMRFSLTYNIEERTFLYFLIISKNNALLNVNFSASFGWIMRFIIPIVYIYIKDTRINVHENTIMKFKSLEMYRALFQEVKTAFKQTNILVFFEPSSIDYATQNRVSNFFFYRYETVKPTREKRERRKERGRRRENERGGREREKERDGERKSA